MEVWFRSFSFLYKYWMICRFHVNLPGCNLLMFRGWAPYSGPKSSLSFFFPCPKSSQEHFFIAKFWKEKSNNNNNNNNNNKQNKQQTKQLQTTPSKTSKQTNKQQYKGNSKDGILTLEGTSPFVTSLPCMFESMSFVFLKKVKLLRRSSHGKSARFMANQTTPPNLG